MPFDSSFERFCRENGIELLLNAPLSDYTTFRVGGCADCLALPESEEQLSLAAAYLKSNNVPFTVLGKGSNVLVSDKGIRGVTMVTSKAESIELVDEVTIKCSAGTPLIRLCMFALEHSLTGLEFAYGIPGTAGGAAFMNAGAYGGEMKDVLVCCEHINKQGKPGRHSAKGMRLGYRRSVYCKNGFVITSVTVRLKKGNKDEIRAKMDDLLGRRKAKQPLDYPSAGSTFKRPEGYFAGALIEQCGLKGYSYGGAAVSEKHAGFVINKNGAAASDILNLVKEVQKTVFEQTGVMLEPEIRLLGEL